MNLNTFGSWLNNNPGILAVILFIVGLLVTFTIWLLRKILSKNPKKSKPLAINPAVKSIVNAGRDIHIGRDVIGEQHNITNNTYTSPESKNVEYQTPDKAQKNQGSTIIIGSPLTSDLRNKKF